VLQRRLLIAGLFTALLVLALLGFLLGEPTQ
jgi:hypothetical protein